nr:MAG TPA: Protein of unknown function (DUF4051) [Caudoviricetes sp.]
MNNVGQDCYCYTCGISWYWAVIGLHIVVGIKIAPLGLHMVMLRVGSTLN